MIKRTNKAAFLLICVLNMYWIHLYSQSTAPDSLLSALKFQNRNTTEISDSDTSRINTLSELSRYYLVQRNFSSAMKYARIAQNISEKLLKKFPGNKAKTCLANSLRSVAEIYKEMEDYANCLKQLRSELTYREDLGNKRDLALCYNNVGLVYNSQGKVAQAFEYYFKALRSMEESTDKRGLGLIYNSLGVAYAHQNNPSKALEYYRKEQAEGDRLNDVSALARSYVNIGNIFADQRDYNSALKEYTKFLKMAGENKNKYMEALAYLNIGDVYTNQGDYRKALETNSNAIRLFEELGSKSDMALCYYNQGDIYLAQAEKNPGDKKSNLTESRKYFLKSLSIYEKIGEIDGLNYCYESLSTLDSLSGNSKGALENYKKHIFYRDSLHNQENTAKSVRAEMNYEFDKKEAVSNLEQEKKDAFALQENARQKSIRNLFIVAFAFMLILAVFIFRSYYQKRKINSLISSQKMEVEKQKWIVEKNQKQIIDSINYAKRIQASMLPNQSVLKKAFPESFIFYKPKDIVSGDFYWFYSIPGTAETVVVLADCTGHGVPGAFLSMVGTTLLNEIVSHKNISDPAAILRALNAGLTSTLVSKRDETHSDGMDISILKIERSTNRLLFAGANQTLYIAGDNELEKIEPQVYSIDGAFDLEGNNTFASIERKINSPASIFLSSDGYADQTGETSRKKFLSSRFEKLLSEIHLLSSNGQLEKLEHTFNDWKGSQKQLDDILVIGIKI